VEGRKRDPMLVIVPKMTRSKVSTNWVSDCHPANPEDPAPKQF
jgi:hypothetical protein